MDESDLVAVVPVVALAGPSFEDTNWWMVRRSAQPERPQGYSARELLCQTYWTPIFCYLRRRGCSPEDAQDLTQDFFAWLLKKNCIRSARRKKGKFRSFLLTLLKRFLVDQKKHATRGKRGGGIGLISLDGGDTEFRRRIEPVDESTPDKAFERSWASTLLHHCLELLEEECAAHGTQMRFRELKPVLSGESNASYAEIARKLQLTESAVKVSAYRLRQRLRELLKAEIAKTAANRRQIEEEFSDLYAALSQS
jgi:RNA polymerase sigma factor (sigma-70 family)